MIPFNKPYLPLECEDYVSRAIKSGWVSRGHYIEKVEQKLKDLFGFKYVVLTSSGTAAVSLMAVCHLNHGPTLPLIVPSCCYVGAVNPFTESSGYDLKLSTIQSHTLNAHIPPEVDQEEGPVGFLAVHNLGNVIPTPDLRKLFPNVLIFEDCCEALGGRYWEDGPYVGSDCDYAAFSFHGSKIVTSGEGGCFVTNNPIIYQKAKAVATQGVQSKPYVHGSWGLNFKMSNINAALLYGQLKHFDRIFEMRRKTYDYYLNHIDFGSCSRSSPQILDMMHGIGSKPTEHANWSFGICVADNRITFEETDRFFRYCGIEIRPFFPVLNTHRHLSTLRYYSDNCQTLHPSVGAFYDTVFMIPTYAQLSEGETHQRDYIVEKVNEYLHNFR